MRYLPTLLALLLAAGCSLHDEIDSTASSWQGHPLEEVEAAWGPPVFWPAPANWTTWRLGNDQGGWIVRFHTDDKGRINAHTVTTWGTLPNDLPHELAPSRPFGLSPNPNSLVRIAR